MISPKKMGIIKKIRRLKRVNKFFLITLFLMFTGGQLIAAAPESEIERLQRENRELREKLLKAERELSGYRMWLGNIAFDHTKMARPDREIRLLAILEEISRRGNALSMSALSVREECLKLIAELPLGPARKAQIELRLDELERASMNFASLTIPGSSDVGSCRVLAVERKLKVVAISAGSGKGVFPGMIFSSKQNKNLKLRVIGTRFEGSVAEIVSGEAHEFTPGMEMSALHQDPGNRQRILEL